MSLTDPADPDASAGVDADLIVAKFLQGLHWATAATTLGVLFGLQVPVVLGHRDGYSSVAAQFLAIGVFTAVTLVVVVAVRRGRPVGWWRWPMLALVLLVSVLATATVLPGHHFGPPHWSYGTVGWPLALLTLERGIGPLAGLLGTHYAATAIQAAVAGQSTATLAGVVGETVVTASFQVAIGVFATVQRRIASAAVRAAREEERVHTAEAVAAQLHADRRARYAELASTTAPLLAGLASGALDPAHEEVRRACAVEAARMRRLFAEGAEAPDPLLHELRACIDLAERNGVSVQFAQRGERPPVPGAVRRLLTEPAVAALATARSTARVTVVGTGGTVTVSVVADAPPEAVPAVETTELTTSTVVSEERIWVKVTWRART
ncbi:hypothetical protein [Goodfellowiella coeruleoviolacea]|uniref:ATP-binding protein n=1 Tax=Goodfellowiella coeruleoviolacea TaxID=334858 RepID=A0AAE3GAW6_9PSEU|nr:hypothetical protein [Goodfellowiella coeruleoviolacea]MCP2163679.1 hypothetical protein [Goodfellowiella coeruleoviolacea]